MLPFEIRTANKTIADFCLYYEQKHGKMAYDKLYTKVKNSTALAKLCGLSISQKRPPTAHDFRLMGSNMFLLGGMEKITLAALIMLREWGLQVNQIYNMATQDTIDSICRNIIAQSRLLHL